VVAASVEDLLRRLAPEVLGALVRRYGHFDLAEDAVQEALLTASSQWAAERIPESPRGWLITVASRRLVDLLRSEGARREREETVAQWTMADQDLSAPAELGVSGADDTLILLFMCCHPELSPASQIALTLRAVGGLGTAEIARAFLASEATMTRRMTRAKESIATSQVPFRMPSEERRPERVRAVLAEGLALVTAAMTRGPVGPYQLQAAIAALHDEAPDIEGTDWPQILALYELLLRFGENPVVRLNHAVALALVRGPRPGLEQLGQLESDDRIAHDHRLHAVRGHLLEMAGKHAEARESYLIAARTTSLPQQRYLHAQAARLETGD
jgi:RNA polymerase sigma factor (sigma-70 family)